ncbi:hypothetical protein PAERUG_E16_London_17_VIM_2_04_14_06123 [Pseudomonas aeruginosa]|nr:hypothetical protein PAERUG_E16_London_17_VIM_2_04_14_06123 [Pseudomonas aeruginosa]
MAGTIALHLVGRRLQRIALGAQLGAALQGHLAPALEGRRLQAQRRETLDGRGQFAILQCLPEHRLQRTPRRRRAIAGGDLLGAGQAQPGAGLQQVGAGALAFLEGTLVERQLGFQGAPLGFGQDHLLAGEQGFAVGGEQAHRQFLAAPAELFVGEQRLGLALAVARVGLVIEQRLLQAEGRGVAAIVALDAGVALADGGVVARLVVVVAQARQQAGTADGAVFAAGAALVERRLEGRVVAHRQLVGVQQAQRLGRRGRKQRGGQQAGSQAIHSSPSARWVRSASGLNR